MTERLYNAFPFMQKKELYRDFCSCAKTARITQRTQIYVVAYGIEDVSGREENLLFTGYPLKC